MTSTRHLKAVITVLNKATSDDNAVAKAILPMQGQVVHAPEANASIAIHVEQLPVDTYEGLDKLHQVDTYKNADRVLHVGQMERQPDVLLEVGGDSLGYGRGRTDVGGDLKDAEGKLPAYSKNGKLGLPADKQSYQTRVAVHDLAVYLHANGFPNVQINDTRGKAANEGCVGGKFLCEYEYAYALMHAQPHPDQKVFMICLPSTGDGRLQQTDSEVRDLIKGVLGFLAK